jgi:hypothetical protein
MQQANRSVITQCRVRPHPHAQWIYNTKVVDVVGPYFRWTRLALGEHKLVILVHPSRIHSLVTWASALLGTPWLHPHPHPIQSKVAASTIDVRTNLVVEWGSGLLWGSSRGLLHLFGHSENCSQSATVVTLYL